MADTSLDSVLKLLQTFSGKGSTTTQSGGTSTQQTVIDQDTLNATLKSALEGNQGLASIAAGQAQTGMYNSTVNTQLSNDLLARLTSQTAEKTATTTTTKPSTTTTVSNPGAKDSLPMLLALSAGKKGIDKVFSEGLSSVIPSFASSGGLNAVVEAGANTASSFVDTTNLAGIFDASSGISDAAISGISELGLETVGSTVAEEAGSSIWDSITSFFRW